uniref:Acidic protein n=1 Tax=Hordeum vulgare subsp. vulgare TaxID=112509 RepID=A0A8I7BG42_HORVV
MDKYPTPIRARVLLQALLLLLICHATTTQCKQGILKLVLLLIIFSIYSRIIDGIDKEKINLHGLCVIDKPVLGDYCCKVTHECYIDLPTCLQECNKPAGVVARATPPSPTVFRTNGI